MGTFSNNAITDNGRILLSHVQMGAEFIPTKIVMGSGSLPTGTTVRNITDVITPEKTLEITKKKRSNDGTVTIGGVYSNQEVATGFYFRELALYAKAIYPEGQEVTEVLYSYGNAGSVADYMPAYTVGQPVERQIDVVVYIGNDTKVDLTVESGICVTWEQLEQHNVAAEAHPNITEKFDSLSEVAFSGSYNDLTNKPTIPAKTTVVNNLTSTSTTSALSAYQGKVLKDIIDDLAPVASSGSYSDLTGKPTIPSVINNLTSTSTTSALSAAQGKALKDTIDDLAPVASSGSYSDLTGKPTIPSVINNLTSTSISSALSAYQGKVLKGLIDDAVADSHIVTGIYTGNGSASRSFSFGFQPTVVIVSSDYGLWSERCAVAVRGVAVGYPDTLLSITSTGFTIYYDTNALTNMDGKKYFYAIWH